MGAMLLLSGCVKKSIAPMRRSYNSRVELLGRAPQITHIGGSAAATPQRFSRGIQQWQRSSAST